MVWWVRSPTCHVAFDLQGRRLALPRLIDLTLNWLLNVLVAQARECDGRCGPGLSLMQDPTRWRMRSRLRTVATRGGGCEL